MKTLLAFITCLIWSVVSAQNDCRNFIEGVWNQRISPNPDTLEQREYFANSGIKGKFDLGEKARCEENEASRYYILAQLVPIIRSKNGAFTQVETGICVPAYCPKELLMADRILVQKLFETNKMNVSLDAQAAVRDINEAPHRGAGFILFMAFISLLVILSIYSTVVVYQKKKESLAQMKENTYIKSRVKIFLDKAFWIFKAFDLKDNGRSLYVTAKEVGQSEQISTFGLLRIFASGWIVIVHTRNESVYRKPYEFPANMRLETFMVIGILAVEYFFFLGGFLAAYTLIGKALREGVGVGRYLSAIFHRLVRIWPAIFFSIVFYWYVVAGMTNGPLMGRFMGEAKVCEQIWWMKFLLIDNYITNRPGGCGITWYLSADFQIYLALVIVVFLYVKKRYMGYLAAFGLSCFSFFYGFHRYQYAAAQGRVMAYWYVHAVPRSYEVMIGVIFGFQYYEYTKNKAQKNFFAYCEKYAGLRHLLFAFGLYLNYFATFNNNDIIFGGSLPIWAWETVRRLAMTLGAAFVFLPLANGAVSFIRSIMNLRIFQILGKLSFGIYLLHYPIIMVLVFTQEHLPEEYSQGKVLLLALKVLSITTAITVPYYLLYEKPIINIESYLTKRANAKKTKKNPDMNVIIQPKQDLEKPDQVIMIEKATMRQSSESNLLAPKAAVVLQDPAPLEIELQDSIASKQGEEKLNLIEQGAPTSSSK